MKLFTRLSILTAMLLLPLFSYANFKLSDFEGKYIGYSSSASGNTISDPQTAGLTSVFQFKLNRDGTGQLNFLNSTLFLSTTDVNPQDLANLPIQFSITNPCLGTGTLTIFGYPVPGSNLETTFVASKGQNKKRIGKSSVTNLLINVNGFSGSNPAFLRSAYFAIAQRQ